VERATAHLQLAIDVDSEPISGSVSNGANGTQPFSGWIELVAAIEAARSSGSETDGSGAAGGQTLGSLPGAKASEL
jgi:hypothetical protein